MMACDRLLAMMMVTPGLMVVAPVMMVRAMIVTRAGAHAMTPPAVMGADIAADEPDLLDLQRRFNRVRRSHRAGQRHGLGACGNQ